MTWGKGVCYIQHERMKSKMIAEAAFFARHDPLTRGVLRAGVVGIAGAGGLGSNVALALVRAGIGKLIIADFDRIEVTNLNRQQYFADQVGQIKVEALADNLRRIHPFTVIVAHPVRVTRRNIIRLFADADILIEAFDRAGEKQMLIESWMSRFPDRPIIAASGLSGVGGNNRMRERRIGNLYLIGDGSSEPRPGISPLAPRVAVAAGMQANLAVELLIRIRRRPCSK